MPNKFTAVPLSAIAARLIPLGFNAAAPDPRSNELVYERELHSLPGEKRNLWVLVYTSVGTGRGRVRGPGEDAIRVSLIWLRPDEREQGVQKNTRVNRVGPVDGVLNRMESRINDAITLAHDLGICPKCGAPVYPDTGNCMWWKCRKGLNPAPLGPQAVAAPPVPPAPAPRLPESPLGPQTGDAGQRQSGNDKPAEAPVVEAPAGALTFKCRDHATVLRVLAHLQSQLTILAEAGMVSDVNAASNCEGFNSDEFNRRCTEHKNEFARLEAEQERAAYAAKMERDRNRGGRR